MVNIEELRPAIRSIMTEVIRDEIAPRLDNLEKRIEDLASMKTTVADHETRITALERSVEFTAEQVRDINKEVIPKLDDKFNELNTQVCMNLLDLDTHRRKWSLIINGLQGKAGEHERDTRKQCREFAAEKLGVPDANTHHFTACHRLSQRDNAGIILGFSDLSERNAWLESAKNLKGTGSTVSISPDIHPCLRQLKSEIMTIRKALPPEKKQGAQVKYMPHWPYVCLKVRGEPNAVVPKITKGDVVRSFLAD